MNRSLVLIVTGLLLSACDQGEDGGAKFRIPGPNYQPDASKGRQVFTVKCAKCHAEDASGTVNGPALLGPVYLPKHHGDMAFYWAVSKGVKQHHWHFGDMPPVTDLLGEDVADIIAFIRFQQRYGAR